MYNKIIIGLTVIIPLAVLYKYLNIQLVNLLVIIIGIYAISIKKFNPEKNPKYYEGLFTVSVLTILLGLINLVLYDGQENKITKNVINSCLNLLIDFYRYLINLFGVDFVHNFLIGCGVLFLFYFCIIKSDNYNELTEYAPGHENKQTNNLYYEREKDLERLEKAFNNYNSIGVVGDWGSGKTLLTKSLEEKLARTKSTNWNFIRINLLSCKVDKVELIIVSEIEAILEKHHIVSSHTRTLKNLLGSSNILNSVYSSIFPMELYSKALENLKKEILNNGIHMVIVAEDIDRVDDSKAIDKLISITNALQDNSSDAIKTLYEYSYCKLVKVNRKFDREFLNKYIKCEIYVTPIPFGSLINSLIKQNNYKKFSVEDFLFLNSPTELREFNAQFSINLVGRLSFIDYPVRKVEHFLEAIENYLEETSLDNFHLREGYLRAIIVFFYIKYFDLITFKRLENFTTVLDSFVFEERDSSNKTINTTTLRNLLTEYYSYNDGATGTEFINEKKASIEKISNIVLDPVNTKSYIYISLLKYNIYTSAYKKEKLIVEEQGLHNIYYNESIDSLFRNMLWKGKTNKSDIKLFIDDLYTHVFSIADESQWLNLFNTYARNNYNKYYQDDNGFPITGIPTLSMAFRFMAMMIYEDQNWLNLVKLLFNYIASFHNKNAEEQPDWNMVYNCLAYISFKDPKVLYFVLEKYNNINFDYSFTNNERYWIFLQNVLQTLALYGNQERIRADLATLSAYTNPINTKIDSEKIINEILLPLRNSIDAILEDAHTYKIPLYISNELSLFSAFITKNIVSLRHNAIYRKPLSSQILNLLKKDKRKNAINDIINNDISDKDSIDRLILKGLNEGNIFVCDIEIIKNAKSSVYQNDD